MTQDRPWTPQSAVAAAVARRLIESQFPDLAPARLAAAGAGWDNTAFLVNGRWLFRFPRRPVAVTLLETEIAVLPRLAPALPLEIPVPVRVGRPAEEFPHPFAGYERIEGEPACELNLETEQRTALAPALARFLRSLHGVPAERAAAWGAPPDEYQRLDLASRFARAEKELVQLQRRGVLPEIAPWLRVLEQTPESFQPDGDTLVHGDLHACHLLLHEGNLSGVIDWGDLHRGDAAVDLRIVWTWLPPRGRREFLRHYGRVDPERWRMARSRALFAAVMQAAYAREGGHQKLLQWCRTALLQLLE